jgi:extradiol dioxygenase family protein
MTDRPRFHLAFPVHDLDKARAFYGDLLGCPEGRSAAEWVDFDFFGHQIVAHLTRVEGRGEVANEVDGDQVPVRHFGVVLTLGKWREIADKLRKANVQFLIEPHIRFKGEPGEQALHGAAEHGFDKFIEFLVANGADLTAKDANGRTPLDVARGAGGGAVLSPHRLYEASPGLDPGSRRTHPVTIAPGGRPPRMKEYRQNSHSMSLIFWQPQLGLLSLSMRMVRRVISGKRLPLVPPRGLSCKPAGPSVSNLCFQS